MFDTGPRGCRAWKKRSRSNPKELSESEYWRNSSSSSSVSRAVDGAHVGSWDWFAAWLPAAAPVSNYKLKSVWWDTALSSPHHHKRKHWKPKHSFLLYTCSGLVRDVPGMTECDQYQVSRVSRVTINVTGPGLTLSLCLSEVWLEF